jgi:hypothetical protein
VNKPVINLDDDEEVAGGSLPSPPADITASSFVLWNAANTLVTESAAVRATFIQFQDRIAGSIDRLTVFLVKEQAGAREDCHSTLNLLQRLVWAVEGEPLMQAETVPAAVNAETADPEAVFGLIRRPRTPLFLPSDENTEPGDESYTDRADNSGSEEGSEDEEEAEEMDVDAMLKD